MLHLQGSGNIKSVIESTDATAYLILDGHTGYDPVVELQKASTRKWTILSDEDADQFRIRDDDNAIRLAIGQDGQTSFTASANDSIWDFNSTAGATVLALKQNGTFSWFINNNDNDGSLSFADGSSWAGRTERMKIDSSGCLIFQAGFARYYNPKLQVTSHDGATENDGILIHHHNSSTNNMIVFYKSYGPNATVGSITSDQSGTAFNTSSDYRMKNVVRSVQNGLSRTLALNPVEYTYKEDYGGHVSEGFIAHEVDEVFSPAVSGEKDAMRSEEEINPQQLDYGRLTPLLVKAIQELSAKVEALENE
jgi:hypothetical protein